MSVTGKSEVAELVLPKGIIFGDTAQPKQTVYEQSVTPNYLVGTKLVYSDGREFRYARAGAVALAKALMTQGAVSDADLFEQDQATPFATAGETTVTVTIGTGLTIGANKDDLAGGTLMVNKATGINESYGILGSEIGSTDTRMSLVLDTPIRTSMADDTEITIVPNLWTLTLVAPEPVTAMVAGVPLIAVTAAYYYWSQTKGPCPIIVDTSETIVIGDLVGAPATQTTAGAVGIWVTLTKAWGVAMRANTTVDEPCLVFLDIA